MSLLRNNTSRFAQTPLDIDIQRSRFDRTFDHKTTFNTGELVPIFLDEVLPGDTFEVNTNFIVRMSTPIFPVMDNAYLDTYFFFVPNRLVWEHWEAFNGQNDDTFWTQPVEYNVPQLTPPQNGWDKGSLADYFGLPTGVYSVKAADQDALSVSVLPFRAYVKIWNDWFRDQNYMNPAYFTTDDSDRVGKRRDANNSIDGGINSALYGGRPLQVSKFHDYFTSVLPQPEKGPGVSVVGDIAGGIVPVRAYDIVNAPVFRDDSSAIPLQLGTSRNKATLFSGTYDIGLKGQGSFYAGSSIFRTTNPSEHNAAAVSNLTFPLNLGAEFASDSVSLLVNDIRLAFQIQRLYEKDARGGTRYIEILKSHFGVDSPDGRLQRSEYLGGDRVPINVNQVLQQSSTANGSTPLGSTGAYSMTPGSQNSFVKSFTEHGWIIGLACVRTFQSYQQGINRMWSRKRRFDFYWPALANIGEQAVLKKEIYAPLVAGAVDNNPSGYDDAFGYQEAWAEYRYHPSLVTGAFRSNVDGSLDAWHYANDFNGDLSTFVADETFMYQSKEVVDRTLAVTSELENQFIADFYFKNYVTRPMPLYSVPGLIDHH